MLKHLARHPSVQSAGAWLLGLYLAFALRSTRWELHGAEHFAPFATGAPVVAAFWHERLALMPMLWLRARRARPPGQSPIHVLVSRHRDGRFIGAIVRRFGVGVLHGSTSRGGAAALRRMEAVLRAGGQIVITPDGPRGPARRAAPGVVQVAELAATPVLPCAAQTRWRLTLHSWDRMVVPLPFGRGILVCGEPVTVPEGGWQDALPVIEAALNEAARKADRLCGG